MKKLIAIAVGSVLLIVWLWVSWRNGWFPFWAQSTMVPQSITDSLTPTESPTSSANATNTLKSLTPISPPKAADNASILDSLTPKNK